MSRKSTTLFLSLILLLIVLGATEVHANSDEAGDISRSGAGGDSGEVTGKSGSHTAPNKYKIACDHVREYLEEIVYHKEEVKDVFSDFMQRYDSSTDKTVFVHVKARPGKQCIQIFKDCKLDIVTCNT